MAYRDDVPEPAPGPGQVLVEVTACGICGSDLHFAKHGAQAQALASQIGGMGSDTDLESDVFLGHEFSATVLEAGPGTDAPPSGTAVTSIPILLSGKKINPIFASNAIVGGYAERMLLSAPLLLPIPNGLDPRHAALTEPMAVGLHAVNKSGIGPGAGAIVIGCGPVGIATIAALRLSGVEPVVAADFSQARRDLARIMGAHEVVDPAAEPVFEAWARAGTGTPVVFEAVGVPGILNDILRTAPRDTKVVVVGVCMESDSLTPYFGIAKEIALQFVLAYDPTEFATTLRRIAEGEIDVAPLITGEVGLEEVQTAFEDLANPERHCKILVRPQPMKEIR